MNKDLLFFYGLECPHCITAEKFVDELITSGINIKKVEVWHNKENDKLLGELDSGDDMCGGVPFFLNQISGKTPCGEVTMNEIKNWALTK